MRKRRVTVTDLCLFNEQILRNKTCFWSKIIFLFLSASVSETFAVVVDLFRLVVLFTWIVWCFRLVVLFTWIVWCFRLVVLKQRIVCLVPHVAFFAESVGSFPSRISSGHRWTEIDIFLFFLIENFLIFLNVKHNRKRVNKGFAVKMV